MLHLEYEICVCIFQKLCEAEFPAFFQKARPSGTQGKHGQGL